MPAIRSLLRRLAALCLLAALILAPAAAPAQESLKGELLVAAPRIQDPRFRETVIYMVRHDAGGAFGLIVNRPLGKVKLAYLYEKLGILPPKARRDITMHYGGPVNPDRGFVLHDSEKHFPGDVSAGEGVGVSPFEPVLRAMAGGKAPKRFLFIIGYAGWGPGQLEGEMRRGDWITAAPDDALLFGKKHDGKWKRAIGRRYRTL
ncbi:MAG: YqgE/AlgH family protein [bacterium]|nr:YqgE/AlgH family protein [bacterium]